MSEPTTREGIHFIVPAIPVAQPRARATTINGHARMYEAAKEHAIHAFKASCRMAAREVYQGPPTEAALAIELTFVFPRPSAMRWKRRPMPRELHTSRRDIDNLVKGVLDSLNGLCFVDDGQVAEAHVWKFIASGNEQPHVEITIRPL